MARRPFDARQFIKDFTKDIPLVPPTPGSSQTFPSPGRARIAAQRGNELRAAVDLVMQTKNVSRSSAISMLVSIAQKEATTKAHSQGMTIGPAPTPAPRGTSGARKVGSATREVIGFASPLPIPGTFAQRSRRRFFEGVSGGIGAGARRLPKPPSARKTGSAIKDFASGLLGR